MNPKPQLTSLNFSRVIAAASAEEASWTAELPQGKRPPEVSSQPPFLR